MSSALVALWICFEGCTHLMPDIDLRRPPQGPTEHASRPYVGLTTVSSESCRRMDGPELDRERCRVCEQLGVGTFDLICGGRSVRLRLYARNALQTRLRELPVGPRSCTDLD